MFFKKKPSPPASLPPQKALQAELEALLAGLDHLADQFRSGKLEAVPDILKGVPARVEALFLRKAPDGGTSGVLYHITTDFKSMDAEAQLQLITIFGGIETLLVLLRRAATTPAGPEREAAIDATVTMLDQTRARTTIFLCHLARFDLGTQVLTGKIQVEEFRAAVARQNEADTSVIRTLIARALYQKAIVDIASSLRPSFLIMTEQKVEEANPQRFNGVWLPPEKAQRYLAHLAGQQAASLSRQGVA